MDIEELSKSQTVLLVLLVSFVTSMATGIVTVSLMDQAPTSVAQTVNRVIEQTIKEVTAPSETASASTATQPPKTVVVKESDEIAGAVAKSSPSVVRLYSTDGSTFLGLAVVADAQGTLITDSAAVGTAQSVSVAIDKDTSVGASIFGHDASLGVSFLTIATSTLSTTTPAWVPLAEAAHSAALGQTVVLIAGETNPLVGSGLVSSLIPASDTSVALVKTNISGDNVLYGSPIIDVTGSLVGLNTEVSRASSASAFVPASLIFPSLTKAEAK